MNERPYPLQRKAWENAVVGNSEEAAEILSRLLRRLPHDPQTHLQLAEVSFHEGQYDQAKFHYQEAKKHAPHSGKPDFGLAVLSFHAHCYEDAILALREVTAKEESYERDVANALLAYYDGDFFKAIDRFHASEKWIDALDESDQFFMGHQRAWLRSKVGESYLKLRDFPGAISWLTSAINLGDPAPEILYNLGWAFFRERKLEDASHHIIRAITANPKFIAAHMLMAKISIQRGQLLTAGIYLAKAMMLRKS